MNAKKILLAGFLGLSTMLGMGTGAASAGPYRRPVVRPVYRGYWGRPVYPYVYTYPAPVYYGYPTAYYPYPAVTTGVYVGAPGIRVGIGR
jgi:hypothetical protein